ncbi:methylthioribulose 1-phosphate dehydratase [Cyanobacterium stanieri]|uniref:methylthioribulose 1-phosphate dehydratase n=1 Tax=Cyanobacterium stanieri TaxID=102235 RepID=UPI0019D60AAE|nr:methylthioribulose 1-phosphate dehydratase [Cyanobacterium stanieri]
MNTYSVDEFHKASEAIIQTATFLDSKGWTPATSSNFSHVVGNNLCAITVSGKHKGRLTPDDIMVVDFDGVPVDNKKPSAETLLHTTLYQRDAEIGSILHTHSLNSTILSRLIDQPYWQIEGYELQKAFTGINTHESNITIPIFDNSQDIPSLAQEVIAYLDKGNPCWGYLIRGHGVYTWGKDINSALRHLEAIEYLMECELEMIKITGRR